MTHNCGIQIYDCVRGALPNCFPSIAEFEAIVPQHLIDLSQHNFEKLLQFRSATLCSLAVGSARYKVLNVDLTI